MSDTELIAYEKPVLASLGNVKELTFECPAWQCSVTVPPPPAP
ncbi:MAG: lasso RiPP family leader peptide-containing protein [Actinobacteria bacterium]|nr:lasso RiPP family leader peptide-containing protein [Actinomycetota bacterium]